MKGDTTLLIGIGKPKPKGKPSMLMKPEADEGEDDVAEAKKSAFSLLAQAVKDDDAEAGVEAMQSLYDLCSMHSSPDDYED